MVESSTGQHPVGDHRYEHREQPHAQIRQGRNETVLRTNLSIHLKKKSSISVKSFK